MILIDCKILLILLMISIKRKAILKKNVKIVKDHIKLRNSGKNYVLIVGKILKIFDLY